MFVKIKELFLFFVLNATKGTRGGIWKLIINVNVKTM